MPLLPFLPLLWSFPIGKKIQTLPNSHSNKTTAEGNSPRFLLPATHFAFRALCEKLNLFFLGCLWGGHKAAFWKGNTRQPSLGWGCSFCKGCVR